MYPPTNDLLDGGDAFRLHYVLGAVRCVVSYDTLGDALEGAAKQLHQHGASNIWISDAQRRPVIDRDQVRTRLARAHA
jgi:hypothetical protein